MSYNGRNRHHGPRNWHGRGGRDLDIHMANGPRLTNNENPRTHYNQYHKNRQGRNWHNWSNDDLAFTNERRSLVHEDTGSSGSDVSDLDVTDNDSSVDLTSQKPRYPGNQHHYWNRGQYQRPQNYDGARYQGAGQPDRRRGHPWNQQDRGQAKSGTAGGIGIPFYGGNSNENNQNGQRRPNGIYDADGDIKMVDVFQLGETSYLPGMDTLSLNIESELRILARMHHYAVSVIQWCGTNQEFKDRVWEANALAQKIRDVAQALQECVSPKIQALIQRTNQIGQAAQSIGYVSNYVQSRSHTSQTLQAETHLLESMHGQTLAWQIVFGLSQRHHSESKMALVLHEPLFHYGQVFDIRGT
ncbi:hypothetical protein N7451_009951 [Penicillium sp. IBT 35674x]|nr:hypothetical protein N7451_009951 [Penicillium sp. IBT 35674x]